MGFPLTRRAFPCYTENVPDPIHKGNQIDLASKLWQASIGFQGPTHFRISYRLTLKISPYSYRYEKRVILIIKMIRELLYKNSYHFFRIKIGLVSKLILKINNQL